jgi:hypothetical protein
MLSQSFDWAFAARIIPTIVGIGAILFCSLSLINDVFGLHERDGGVAIAGKSEKIHMDIASKTAHLPASVILIRGLAFFDWMVSFMAVMAVIGLIPTVPIFVVLFMRTEPREWMAKFRAARFRFVMTLIGLRSTALGLIEPFAELTHQRTETPEPWRIVIPMAASVVLLIYVVFDQLLAIPWPPTLAGTLFPALKFIPSV